MSARVKISVVIPCFNAAHFLRQTLASAINQTYPVHEVIVVDDGSTDNSAAVAAAFGPPVRVMRQPNQGESVAHNRAISVAQGEWVALLDADDIWEPEKIERQMEVALKLSESFVCVYNDCYSFDETTRYPFEPRPEYHAQPDARVSLLFDWCVVPSTAIIRREPLRTARFPEDVRHGEDPIFTAQLRDHGEFFRIPEALTGKRVSSAQLTAHKDHHLLKTKSLFYWFSEHVSSYTQTERDYVFGRIRNDIAQRHDDAYRERELDVVRAYRRLARELYGKTAPPTDLFRKRLYPMALYGARDWSSRVLRKISRIPV